ncbi:MAG: alkaline phosphatase family protein [Chloroflexota bacterium]
METRSDKFLVIGLDGATFEWLHPLTQSNKLPFLKQLLAQSAWGQLESTVPPFTATAWSSFMTGANPGEHGILAFEVRDRFNYDQLVAGFVNGDQHDLTIWEVLNANNKTVGVVNVPLTYPARPVDGYMITGMMSPKNGDRITYPSELLNTLGDYKIDVEFIRDGDDFDRYVNLDKEKMLVEIHQVMQARLQKCWQLVQEKPTDFFMVVFTCTDRLSHFFWDELCDVIAGNLPTPLHTAVLDLLIELDSGIEKLIEFAGSEPSIMLMSDHGFGPSPTKRAHLNVWLEQNNWLAKRQRESWGDLEYWRVWIGQRTWLKQILRSLIPQKSQDSLTKSSMQNSREIVDWTKTKAFLVPIYFQVCGISINSVGDRREGIVPAGDDYESVRIAIIEELKQLTDPKTRRPIVERVSRREDIFKGQHLQSMPDIIVELDPDYVGAQSLAGSQIVEPHIPFRSGEHRSDGIFSLKSPTVPAQADVRGLKLQDVAATICYAMGLPQPTAFDATVQSQIFDQSFFESNPIQFENIRSNYEPFRSDADLSEEELVEQRLRGLGYLE